MLRNTWEVRLHVHGPVKVQERISLRTIKGLSVIPFYSNVTIENQDEGIKMKVMAFG